MPRKQRAGFDDACSPGFGGEEAADEPWTSPGKAAQSIYGDARGPPPRSAAGTVSAASFEVLLGRVEALEEAESDTSGLMWALQQSVAAQQGAMDEHVSDIAALVRLANELNTRFERCAAIARASTGTACAVALFASVADASSPRACPRVDLPHTASCAHPTARPTDDAGTCGSSGSSSRPLRRRPSSPRGSWSWSWR